MVAVTFSSGLIRLIWGEEEGLEEEVGLEEEEGLEEECTLHMGLRPHQCPHNGKDKVDKNTHQGSRDS